MAVLQPGLAQALGPVLEQIAAMTVKISHRLSDPRGPLIPFLVSSTVAARTDAFGVARETGNGISLICGFKFPVLLVILFCKSEVSAAMGASCTALVKAEAEKFPVNFPVTGNICGRAVSARLRPPPFPVANTE